jgi:hypothetical protein
MKAGSELAFTAAATDPDPGSGITYGIDADFADAHAGAVINADTGAFTWVPSAGETGTHSLTVTADDNPTNGGVAKQDAKTFSIVVGADTLAPQSNSAGTFVAGGDTVTLTWDSVAGASYKVQLQALSASDWSDVQVVTATGASSSVSVTNAGDDATARVIVVDSAATE